MPIFDKQSSQEEWLTTSEAAEHLGVHPSTLRRWADDGDLPVMLTPGGHRRFALSDLRTFSKRRLGGLGGTSIEKVWAHEALTHTRHQIIREPERGWMASFDETGREQSRQLGRRLLGLMIRYVSMEEGGQDLLAEVSQIGRAYARAAKEAGLPLQGALEIAMFFRDGLLETTLDLPEKVHLPPQANLKLLRRLNPVLNELQLAIVDSYESD